MKFSKIPDLKKYIQKMPSPLAVLFEQLLSPIEDEEYLLAFLAGMDAFLTSVKWVTFIGIADVVQKAKEDHTFATSKTLKLLFPYIYQVLSPRQTHGIWVQCVREIIKIYEKDPTCFFVPEFMAAQQKTKDDPLGFEDKIGQLLKFRNKFVHGKNQPSLGEARRLWNEIDLLLGLLCEQLAVLNNYHLIQFVRYPNLEKAEWYSCDCVLDLQGFEMSETSLRKGPIRFYFGDTQPQMRKLYLFKPNYSQHLCLHPFVLLDIGLQLQESNHIGTFLFNEFKSSNVGYESQSGSSPLIIVGEETDKNGYLSKPLIQQYFINLKFITGTSDIENLNFLPGFPRRSYVLGFDRVIDFHTKGFIGRSKNFEKVEYNIAGPSGAILIRGLAGYGKTAFMAKLSRRIPYKLQVLYFISPEKGLPNASTFLLHVNQTIVDKFKFADVITDDQAANLDDLRAMFFDLLQRASDSLQGTSEKLVILVDGLDESERYASSPDEVIQKSLPQSPDDIPDNIFFVFSSRPDDVKLGSIAENIIDLQPFSNDEVVKILMKLNWSKATAETAFMKSKGQPLYFRFLLDGIKRGTLREQFVDKLPDGITGFYKKFWQQCDRDRVQKNNAVQALTGGLKQDVLGVLAAARKPLDLNDLFEVLITMRRVVERNDIVSVLTNDELRKFIIGSKRFALFHDTLREFVTQVVKLRIENDQDQKPINYHEMLALWCRQSTDSEYGQDNLYYHLYHAGSYTEILELLEMDIEKEQLQTNASEELTAKLSRGDTAFGILAARELNDLTKVFRYSLLQLSLSNRKRTSMVIETALLLSHLGHDAKLNQLFDEHEDDGKWHIASILYSDVLKTTNQEKRIQWIGELQKLWNNTDSNIRKDRLVSLLAQLYDVPKQDICTTINHFSNFNYEETLGAILEGFSPYPVLAAQIVLELNFNESTLESSFSELLKLANTVLASGNIDLAWRILPRVKFGLSSISFSFDKSPLYLQSFFRYDHNQVLDRLSFEPSDCTSWNCVSEVVYFSRITLQTSEEIFDSWLAQQPIYAKVLWHCARAAMIQNETTLTKAIDIYTSEYSTLSAHCNIACLTLLSLAQERQSLQGRNQWRETLSDLYSVIIEASGAFQQEKELKEEMKFLLPVAGRYIREIGHLFPDKKSALWFAIASATPALESMLNPEVQVWMRSKTEIAKSSNLLGNCQEILRIVKKKFFDEIEDDSSVKQTIHSLVLPTLIALMDDEAIAIIKDLGSLDMGWKTQPWDLAMLNPNFDTNQFQSLYPCLIEDNGRLINVDEVLEAKIIATALYDPQKAINLWRNLCKIDMDKVTQKKKELDQVGSSEEEANIISEQVESISDNDISQKIEGNNERLDVQTLITTLHASGEYQEAFDLATETGLSQDYWDNFRFSCEDIFPMFLKRLPLILQIYGSNDSLHRCLKTVLNTLSPKEWGSQVDLIFTCPEAHPNTKVTIAYYALSHANGADIIESLLADDGDQILSADEIVVVLIRWIERIIPIDKNKAIDMLLQLTDYRKSQGLEFLSNIETSLINAITVCIKDISLNLKDLKELAERIQPETQQLHLEIVIRMLQLKAEREVVEPMIRIESVRVLLDFGMALFNEIPEEPPDWLIDRLYKEYQQFVSELKSNSIKIGRAHV